MNSRILEDTADFIAGRAVAAMTRYRQQLLPPLFSALMKYSDIHEYSWAAPGHQGGVGFTKTPAGRFYHDYYGENLFRTDMGIERTSLGSLLTILAHLAKAKNMPHAYLVPIALVGSRRYFRL
ncbi:Biodegradative arginine decarboxylase [Escherichia coli]|nr:hypothetical protein [Escherichia coli]VCV64742.1 Biodegradative arginine decarboxylase [Escherichia coli]